MSKKFFIYGTGPQGMLAYQYFIKGDSFENNVFFIDDDSRKKGTKIYNTYVIGTLNDVNDLKYDVKIHIALGHPSIKKRIAETIIQKGFEFFNIVHPSAIIEDNVQVGVGNFFGINSIVNNNAVIENHVIVNSGAIIEHDTKIESFSNISPGSVIGGRCLIEEAVFIGSNSTVRARCEILKNSIIGMGSNVLKNFGPNSLLYGNPAKEISKVDNSFNWKNVL